MTAHLPQPFSTPWLLRILLVIIVVLSLAAGYYEASWSATEKKYQRLEDRFVRVRDQLGRDETQRLIDQSYQE